MIPEQAAKSRKDKAEPMNQSDSFPTCSPDVLYASPSVVFYSVLHYTFESLSVLIKANITLNDARCYLPLDPVT